jgi:hypothetical protein
MEQGGLVHGDGIERHAAREVSGLRRAGRPPMMPQKRTRIECADRFGG